MPNGLAVLLYQKRVYWSDGPHPKLLGLGVMLEVGALGLLDRSFSSLVSPPPPFALFFSFREGSEKPTASPARPHCSTPPRLH